MNALRAFAHHIFLYTLKVKPIPLQKGAHPVFSVTPSPKGAAHRGSAEHI